MKKNLPIFLVFLVIVAAIYLSLPKVPWFFGKQVTTHLGLDLVGGIQALLEADVPEGTTVDSSQMDVAKSIVENRINGLGVSEALVQRAGDRRIVVEIPGVDDPDTALAALKTQGLLEFVDMSSISQTEASTLVGKQIKTDYLSNVPADIGETAPITLTERVWPTILTGSGLTNAAPVLTQTNTYEVSIEFSNEGAQTFATYTSAHTGDVLAIVLDKVVISVPTINNKITDGKAVITGGFDLEGANQLTIQLRYGSLPVPLKIVNTNIVGPTLGQDSLQKSLVGGGIGLLMVIIFMAVYYRLPGLVANLALICYALINFALFRSIPVTLTLPGIAGFVLSIGMAVDANVLIFERLKEELRGGHTLMSAIDLAWSRAWPSIRDSNFSTLITCVILFWFGSAFGASIVKGFSVTLALGVLTSLFTAVIVTRTFLHLVLDQVNAAEHPGWFNV